MKHAQLQWTTYFKDNDESEKGKRMSWMHGKNTHTRGWDHEEIRSTFQHKTPT